MMKRNFQVNLHCDVDFDLSAATLVSGHGQLIKESTPTGVAGGDWSCNRCDYQSHFQYQREIFVSVTSHKSQPNNDVVFRILVREKDTTKHLLRSLEEVQMLDSLLKKEFGLNYKAILPVSPKTPQLQLPSPFPSTGSIMSVLSPVAWSNSLFQFFNAEDQSEQHIFTAEECELNFQRYRLSLTKYLNSLLRSPDIHCSTTLLAFLDTSTEFAFNDGSSVSFAYDGALQSADELQDLHMGCALISEADDDDLDIFLDGFESTAPQAASRDELDNEVDDYCGRMGFISGPPSKRPSPVPMLDLAACLLSSDAPGHKPEDVDFDFENLHVNSSDSSESSFHSCWNELVVEAF
jgi:hypothetical protein